MTNHPSPLTTHLREVPMLPNKLLRPWLRAAVAGPGPLVDVTDPTLLHLSGVPWRAPRHPLLVPGVSVELTAGWFGTAAARLLPGHTVLHPDDITGDRSIVAAVLEADHDARAATRHATLAAASLLGWPVHPSGDGVLVTDVSGSLQAPLDDGLQPGDVITTCLGAPVACLDDLRACLDDLLPGDTITLDVLPRHHPPATRRAVVAATRAGLSQLDITAATRNPRIAGPVHVELTDPDAGGPSAGFGIALSLLAGSGALQLPGPCLVTGEIHPDGSVHPVAGIADKAASGAAAGLDTFLLPAGNADEAPLVSAAGLRPVLVDDLSHAVDLLTGARLQD